MLVLRYAIIDYMMEKNLDVNYIGYNLYRVVISVFE